MIEGAPVGTALPLRPTAGLRAGCIRHSLSGTGRKALHVGTAQRGHAEPGNPRTGSLSVRQEEGRKREGGLRTFPVILSEDSYSANQEGMTVAGERIVLWKHRGQALSVTLLSVSEYELKGGANGVMPDIPAGRGKGSRERVTESSRARVRVSRGLPCLYRPLQYVSVAPCCRRRTGGRSVEGVRSKEGCRDRTFQHH